MSEQTSQNNTEDVNDQANDNATDEQDAGAQVQSKGKDASTLLYGDTKSSEESKDDEESDKKEDDSDDKDDSEDEEKSDEKDDKDSKEYKLSKPETTRLSDADMERIAQFSKEQGLSKEAAQKLVEQESQAREDFFEDLQDQHRQLISQWRSDIEVDKEIGGDGFKKHVELAKRVVDKYGTQKFKEDLEASGYGNHPEVVRVFARIGKAMSSGDFVKAGHQAGGDKSMADIFYGNKEQ